MNFSTKAGTLKNIEGLLASATVLPQICFSVEDWGKDSESILEIISDKGWFEEELIVRSSALCEDVKGNSLAGKYRSVQNVKGKTQIVKAVNAVISSYQDGRNKDQVLLQPMLKDVIVSGVALSKETSSGAPYIVINYDNKSGSTDTITSGRIGEVKTFYFYKFYNNKTNCLFDDVIDLIYELEKLFKTDSIDIEFAFDKTNVLYLLQVRELCTANKSQLFNSYHQQAIKRVYNKVKSRDKPHPYLYGSKTVYGMMPDWNPAEIIGARPRPLSLSLYKELITDNIWAYQRNNYGYKNLRSFPLLVSFEGIPYIDVRISFNSFIPADIDSGIAEKLVNYYLNQLIENPFLHDKVEFEIVFSCYTLDLNQRLKTLYSYGFKEVECQMLAESLRNLTNRIINKKTGLWKKDIEKIEVLKSRIKTIDKGDLSKIEKIYWLIEDCKRYGTLPFAGLARGAFIAVQILKSLVATGILSILDYNCFMNSLSTVSSHMNEDFSKLSKECFLQKYGHLRPGTYDILSKTYSEAPEKYFDWSKRQFELKKINKFLLSLEQLNKIEKYLKSQGLDHDVLGLFDFIKKAIEGREYSKFIFTQSVSKILELFKEVGNELSFTDNDCSYADISIINKLNSTSADVFTILEQSIAKGKHEHKITENMVLPMLITDPNEVYSFHTIKSEPNFITMMKVCAPVVNTVNQDNDFENCILFLPSADPGYDWIFTHRIAGFVTMYGGVNSHMAIRAIELGIPAVIGAGKVLYNNWIKANLLDIDCANKTVRIIS